MILVALEGMRLHHNYLKSVSVQVKILCRNEILRGYYASSIH